MEGPSDEKKNKTRLPGEEQIESERPPFIVTRKKNTSEPWSNLLSAMNFVEVHSIPNHSPLLRSSSNCPGTPKNPWPEFSQKKESLEIRLMLEKMRNSVKRNFTDNSHICTSDGSLSE